MFISIDTEQIQLYGQIRAPVNLQRAINEIERQIINRAFVAMGGNNKLTARVLGLNRTTLIEKVKRLKRLENQRAWKLEVMG